MGDLPNTTAYRSLVVQPIEVAMAFRMEFTLASVLKWLTKWHIDHDDSHLAKALYYIDRCGTYSAECRTRLMFALRLYCLVNGFARSGEEGDCKLLLVMNQLLLNDQASARHLLSVD